MNRFSPTQRRACLVLVVCVLAVILTFLGAWVVLPGVLGAGSSGTGDYDPELYPVDTSLTRCCRRPLPPIRVSVLNRFCRRPIHNRAV